MKATERNEAKYVCTGSNHFRIDESELLYMRCGEFVVSFEGYRYSNVNDGKGGFGLNSPRHATVWAGKNLGLIEPCDFNSNDWHSSPYRFGDGNDDWHDRVMGDYPYNPHEWRGYVFRGEEMPQKYMVWKSNAWKRHSEDYWSAKEIMEEQIWNILSDRFNQKTAQIIKDKGLVREDMSLGTIHLYEEFDSAEELNEAHKALRIKELEGNIVRLKSLPYGETR